MLMQLYYEKDGDSLRIALQVSRKVKSVWDQPEIDARGFLDSKLQKAAFEVYSLTKKSERYYTTYPGRGDRLMLKGSYWHIKGGYWHIYHGPLDRLDEVVAHFNNQSIKVNESIPEHVKGAIAKYSQK